MRRLDAQGEGAGRRPHRHAGELQPGPPVLRGREAEQGEGPRALRGPRRRLRAWPARGVRGARPLGGRRRGPQGPGAGGGLHRAAAAAAGRRDRGCLQEARALGLRVHALRARRRALPGLRHRAGAPGPPRLCRRYRAGGCARADADGRAGAAQLPQQPRPRRAACAHPAAGHRERGVARGGQRRGQPERRRAALAVDRRLRDLRPHGKARGGLGGARRHGPRRGPALRGRAEERLLDRGPAGPAAAGALRGAHEAAGRAALRRDVRPRAGGAALRGPGGRQVRDGAAEPDAHPRLHRVDGQAPGLVRVAPRRRRHGLPRAVLLQARRGRAGPQGRGGVLGRGAAAAPRGGRGAQDPHLPQPGRGRRGRALPRGLPARPRRRGHEVPEGPPQLARARLGRARRRAGRGAPDGGAGPRGADDRRRGVDPGGGPLPGLGGCRARAAPDRLGLRRGRRDGRHGAGRREPRPPCLRDAAGLARQAGLADDARW
mmetsp:Transcript_67367/g.173446  ORF Transcript_67367/g.173446 Transcript_67367/m.173446 type:complete len:489 (+) Transcript_67367:659-2125(+)